MKKFACLLSVVALVACSESENSIAQVDDFVAQGESSSSAEELSSATSSAGDNVPTSSSSAMRDAPLSSATNQSSASEKTPNSSSSVTAVLSSSSEMLTSSSSYYLDFLDVGAPGTGGGCGAAFSVAAASDGGGGFRPSDQPLPGNYIYPYRLIVEGRTEKLVSDGVPADEAAKTAKREFITVLGLDSLFREASFIRADVEDVLNLIFSYDSVTLYSVAQLFSEKGTLDRSEYCGIWNATWIMNRGWGATNEEKYYAPYEKLREWVRNLASRGCFRSGNEELVPTLIIGNVYRKCIGLPYCYADLFGTVQRAGLKDIISDSLYFCDTRGWTLLVNYEDDTKDVPCDKIGKVFKSASLYERYYICKADGWNIATKLDYETQDLPCGDSPKLVQSPTDSTRFYLCKDSKWKIATQLEIKTTNVPCDRVGKLVDSGTKDYKGQIVYICRDTGWDTATQREADIGDRACDAEGKTVKGVLDTNMSYVCYQNAWTDFYDAPCDTDNKRVRDWKEGLKEDYICYNGKWYYSRNWSCDLPKEYYFNPNVQYGMLTDDRDGATYRTVEVNGYTWMAENLRYVPTGAQSVPVQEGCEIAGRFYSKEAAKTACPAGWKLPDSAVVNSLEKGYDRLSMYLQNCYNQQLVSQIGSICSGFECNTYGTSFLSFGTSKNPSDKSGKSDAYYWASNRQNPDDVWIFHIGFNDMACYKDQKNTDDLMTIRCVKE